MISHIFLKTALTQCNVGKEILRQINCVPVCLTPEKRKKINIYRLFTIQDVDIPVSHINIFYHKTSAS